MAVRQEGRRTPASECHVDGHLPPCGCPAAGGATKASDGGHAAGTMEGRVPVAAIEPRVLAGARRRVAGATGFVGVWLARRVRRRVGPAGAPRGARPDPGTPRARPPEQHHPQCFEDHGREGVTDRRRERGAAGSSHTSIVVGAASGRTDRHGRVREPAFAPPAFAPPAFAPLAFAPPAFAPPASAHLASAPSVRRKRRIGARRRWLRCRDHGYREKGREPKASRPFRLGSPTRGATPFQHPTRRRLHRAAARRRLRARGFHPLSSVEPGGPPRLPCPRLSGRGGAPRAGWGALERAGSERTTAGRAPTMGQLPRAVISPGDPALRARGGRTLVVWCEPVVCARGVGWSSAPVVSGAVGRWRPATGFRGGVGRPSGLPGEVERWVQTSGVARLVEWRGWWCVAQGRGAVAPAGRHGAEARKAAQAADVRRENPAPP